MSTTTEAATAAAADEDDALQLTPRPDLMMRPADRTRAACRGTPLSWWWPKDRYASQAARAICADCPVAVQCGIEGLGNATERAHRSLGIWGGMTEQHRRDLLAAHGWDVDAAAATLEQEAADAA